MYRFLLLLTTLLAGTAFADSVAVTWVNPNSCTVANSGAYTHLGMNILVNGTLRAAIQPGTSYQATLNSGDVVSATVCGYCGAPPANGGAWQAPGRCAVGNESAPTNGTTYTNNTPPPPTSNGTIPTTPTLQLGAAAPPPTQTETDTFTSLATSWVQMSGIAKMTASSGNVQCGAAETDCAIIRNTAWAANQSSTITIGAIAAGDEVGAFVRATTGGQGILCTQAQGGQAQIIERAGGAWNFLGNVPGVPLAVGGTLTCEAVGNTYTLKVNGVTLIQRTNAAHPTGTPGIEVYDPSSISARISDWSAAAL